MHSLSNHVHSPLHQAAPLPCGQRSHDAAECPPQTTSASAERAATNIAKRRMTLFGRRAARDLLERVVDLGVAHALLVVVLVDLVRRF